jgi:hypothetical protein
MGCNIVGTDPRLHSRAPQHSHCAAVGDQTLVLNAGLRAESPLTHLGASLIAGFFAALASNPVDLIKVAVQACPCLQFPLTYVGAEKGEGCCWVPLDCCSDTALVGPITSHACAFVCGSFRCAFRGMALRSSFLHVC